MRFLIVLLCFLGSLAFSQVNDLARLDSLLKKNPNLKIGVALSGGGAKGFAHIGVLKVFEKYNVKPSYISGTSMGAIVGGLYSAGYSADELEKIISKLDFSELFINTKRREFSPFYQKTTGEKYILKLPFKEGKLSIPESLSSGQKTLEFLSNLLGHLGENQDFSKQPIPFLCVATDLETGKPKVFTEGYLPKAIMASSALPGLISPIEVEEKLYVDGGFVNNLPVKELKDRGMDVVVAIDLYHDQYKKEDINSASDVFSRISNFSIRDNVNKQLKHADLILKPYVEDYSLTSFGDSKPIIKIGQELAESYLSDSLSYFKNVGEVLEKTSFKNQINDVFFVEELSFTETSEVDQSEDMSIQKIMRIDKFPLVLNYDQIQKKIDLLYASGSYKKVLYRFKKKDNGRYNLVLDVKKVDSQSYLKVGFHYDKLFKASFLGNLSNDRFLFDNSKISLDFVLGDNPRYYFDYYYDNGLKPSVGISSSYKSVEAGNLSVFSQNPDFTFNYDLSEFYLKVFTQSTLANQWALGLGFDFSSVDITNKNSTSNLDRKIDDSDYYSLYGYLKYDSRNRSYLASKGTFLEASYKSVFSSNEDSFSPFSIFQGNLSHHQPLNDKLSVNLSSRYGFFSTESDDIPDSLKFLVGGYFEQDLLNTVPFFGLDFGHSLVSALSIASLGLQYEIFNNHYGALSMSTSSLTDNLQDLTIIPNHNLSMLLGYTYSSPLGPVELYFSHNFDLDSNQVGINIGYWF